MKCGFAVSFSSHEVAPERSQPALNSGLEMAAMCHGQVVYSVNTGGASRGIGALRGAVCGSLQLRRLSYSGSAAMAAIVPSLATGGGSGGQQQSSVSVRLPRRTVTGGHAVVPGNVSINTALPNPSTRTSLRVKRFLAFGCFPLISGCLVFRKIGRAHV